VTKRVIEGAPRWPQRVIARPSRVRWKSAAVAGLVISLAAPAGLAQSGATLQLRTQTLQFTGAAAAGADAALSLQTQPLRFTGIADRP
jgi:hypothetical protein